MGKLLKLWRFYPFASEFIDYRAFPIGPFMACIVYHYSYHRRTIELCKENYVSVCN